MAPHAPIDPIAAHPLSSGPALSPDAARQYRLRAIFDCGKLDPQVGDTPVLAPFPLVLDEPAWRDVAAAAESLARESLDAQRELLTRPDLHRHLALPAAIRRVLRRCSPADADAGPRVCRFDFHWATDGPGSQARWQISEVNADVPGGFIEAGAIGRLMHELLADPMHGQPMAGRTGAMPAPDPAEALAVAIARRVPSADRGAAAAPLVALVHATAFADDFQVMARLAACLEARGLRATLAAPDHISWPRDGAPRDIRTGDPLGAIVRFFPAEWLPDLTPPWLALVDRIRPPAWAGFFRTGAVAAMANPGTALLVQSKRWPLVWARLRTPLDAWRSFLPETRDPRAVRAELSTGRWVLKPAMGRVGEGILIPGLPIRDERAIRRDVRRNPGHWVAQRRFESVPIESPLGPLHVCLGVYVIDGRAAGLYARAASRPLIDQAAWELPVLVRPAAASHSIDRSVPSMEAA